jgi:hypothetical protein
VSDVETWRKEQLSVAYLHAVATAAGFTISQFKVDKDGVDATLRSKGIMVDIQLKCTSTPKVIKAGFSFPLDTKTYDKLRSRERSAAGYLVLVVVPADAQDWIEHQPKHVLLACHAYWAQIQDRNDVAKGKTKSIHLPTTQALDGDALKSMFNYSLQMVSGR